MTAFLWPEFTFKEREEPRPGLLRFRALGGDLSLCFFSFTAVCQLPAIRWSQSSTHSPVAQAAFPSPPAPVYALGLGGGRHETQEGAVG